MTQEPKELGVEILASLERRCADTPGNPANYSIPVIEVRDLLAYIAHLESELRDARAKASKFFAPSMHYFATCGWPESTRLMITLADEDDDSDVTTFTLGQLRALLPTNDGGKDNG